MGFQGWPLLEGFTSGANFTSVWLARSQTNTWTTYGMRGGNAMGLSEAILNTFGDEALNAAALSPPQTDDPLATGDGVELIHGLPVDDPLVAALPAGALTGDLVGVLAALGYEAAPGLSTILADPCDEEQECLYSVASPFEAMALGVEGALVGAPFTASTLTQLACCWFPLPCLPCITTTSPPVLTPAAPWGPDGYIPSTGGQYHCRYKRQVSTTTTISTGERWYTYPVCISCAATVITPTYETGGTTVQGLPCPPTPYP